MNGLYIHLPFCHAKCHYCDFAAFAGREKEMSRYVACLLRELEGHAGKSVDSIFFGGGTPTALPVPEWEKIFAACRRLFSISPTAEITAECNPESATPDTLAAFRRLGINRLSFGLQAVQPGLLKSLNRLHDFNGFLAAYRSARTLGFDNINVDLMFGLPGQTLKDWDETLRCVAELEPEHVSAYALKVEEGTVLDRRGVMTDDDAQAEMYERAADVMEQAGLAHYEISNFARPGRESLHNLKYWRNTPCIGAGVSAAGYDEAGLRYANMDELAGYMEAVEAGRSPRVEETRLDARAKVGEDLMLALRLKEGAAVSPEARALFGADLDRFLSLGFLTAERGGARLRPTRRGWLLSNQMFQSFV